MFIAKITIKDNLGLISVRIALPGPTPEGIVTEFSCTAPEAGNLIDDLQSAHAELCLLTRLREQAAKAASEAHDAVYTAAGRKPPR